MDICDYLKNALKKGLQLKDKIYEQVINTNPADLLLCETLFHNANGYIGIRSCFEEGYAGEFSAVNPGQKEVSPDNVSRNSVLRNFVSSIRGSYINGFYDFIDMPQAEKLYGLIEEKQIMLNIADTQSIRLFLGSEEFNMWTGKIIESRRILNMSKGFSERLVRWVSPDGKEVEICIRRTASFTRPCLFLIDYSVKAINFSSPVSFISVHKGDVENFFDPADPRVASHVQRHLDIVNFNTENNASFITAETVRSKLKVCTAVDHVLSKEGQIKTVFDNKTAVCTIDTQIEQNESITLFKYSIFTDSIRYEACDKKARHELTSVLSVTPDTLYLEQQNYLDDYWNNAFLEIDGDDELQQAVQFNMYQLVQSAGKDGHCSIAAKGLSGEGYEGHYFWDTEIYVEPFFVFGNPAIARGLISHRYSTLEEARKNALLLGHKSGVLFPWRTIMGKECSGFFPAGTAQYHINGDIAWSVIFYFLATGDLDFIIQKGAELVFECARLWIDVGNFYNGQFRINCVTGPDEYTCVVNNNYYTNVCAKRNLEWAVKFYELLKNAGKLDLLAKKINLLNEEIVVFANAAQNMYIPYDEQSGINPQDDSFLSKKRINIADIPANKKPMLLHYHPLFLYRHQVTKQADTVLAHILFDDADPQTVKNSFLYYKDITTHDSSLSTCIFSIAASRLGFYEDAYKYFGNSASLDLRNTAGNTKDGLHIANMGGTYMAIIFGFAGVKVKENGLYISPHLPKHWKTCRFNLRYKGSLIRVTIEGEKINISLIEGKSVPVYVNDKPYII